MSRSDGRSEADLEYALSAARRCDGACSSSRTPCLAAQLPASTTNASSLSATAPKPATRKASRMSGTHIPRGRTGADRRSQGARRAVLVPSVPAVPRSPRTLAVTPGSVTACSNGASCLCHGDIPQSRDQAITLICSGTGSQTGNRDWSGRHRTKVKQVRRSATFASVYAARKRDRRERSGRVRRLKDCS